MSCDIYGYPIPEKKKFKKYAISLTTDDFDTFRLFLFAESFRDASRQIDDFLQTYYNNQDAEIIISNVEE